MVDLQTPGWLLGLLPLIPMVWWLHRFRERAPSRPVPALFLWQGIPNNTGRGQMRRRPDPLWRLRALIVSLLILTLAGPAWIGQSKRAVTVWLDTSPSMLTVEDGGSRAQLAIAALLNTLTQEEIERATIRSLANPLSGLTLAKRQWTQARGGLEEWFSAQTGQSDWQLPPPPLPTEEHWLVTDGAGEGLQPWLEKARISRVIQVGEKTENAAITRLSLRRSLGQPKLTEGLVSTINQGRKESDRLLRVQADGVTLAEWPLTLPPGRELSRHFRIDGQHTSEIEARLLLTGNEEADPLPQDDQLALALPERAWVQAVTLDPACAPPLRAALEALPGISIHTAPNSETLPALICSERTDLETGPVIRFENQRDPYPLSAPLLWHEAAGVLQRLSLEPKLLLVDAAATPARGQPLLTSGEQTLISMQRDPAPVFVVHFDVESSPLVLHPGFPLLISGLLELTLERQLLDEIHYRDRNPLAARIAPRSLQVSGTTHKESTADHSPTGPVSWLILVVLALLVYDLGKLHRPPLNGATAVPAPTEESTV